MEGTPSMSLVGMQGSSGPTRPSPGLKHSPTLLQLAAELFMDAHNGHFAFDLMNLQVQI